MERITLTEDLKQTWPKKFASEEEIFSHIHAGDKIFIGTGCGEPQYLVSSLVNFVSGNPKAFFGIELILLMQLLDKCLAFNNFEAVGLPQITSSLPSSDFTIIRFIQHAAPGASPFAAPCLLRQSIDIRL